MIPVKIEGHLIIPFGRPKWSIEKIKLVGVSTTATYFESETPCAYIDTNRQVPLRLRHFRSIFPEDMPEKSDTWDALAYIGAYLREKCELQTIAEKQFLNLYFEFLAESWSTLKLQGQYLTWKSDGETTVRTNQYGIFNALMPLPQAHLYLEDPLDDTYTFAPQNMFKVDYVFWTGIQLVAVEIDGTSHIGSEAHIRKDRLLQRAGVKTIHITNNELLKYRRKAVERLLPNEITQFIDFAEDMYSINPLYSRNNMESDDGE